MRSVLVGLLLVLSACTADPATAPSPPTQDAPEVIQYAALGDSYTAAPYVISTHLANGCLRSQHNYPTLVAEELGAELTDVSCGGADTGDVLGRQRTMRSTVQPPQIRAVAPGTDLVTVGLGGNDGNLFAQLVRQCPITGPQGQQLGAPGRCGHMEPGLTRRLIAGTQRDLAQVLTTVKARAPRARVVVIGYPRLLGDTSCRALPIAARDVAGATQVAVLLRDAQRAAARTVGASFLDMHALSEGHDACAEEPWVRGVDTDLQEGAAMHPTPAGQQAVADALTDHLTDAGF